MSKTSLCTDHAKYNDLLMHYINRICIDPPCKSVLCLVDFPTAVITAMEYLCQSPSKDVYCS